MTSNLTRLEELAHELSARSLCPTCGRTRPATGEETLDRLLDHADALVRVMPSDADADTRQTLAQLAATVRMFRGGVECA